MCKGRSVVKVLTLHILVSNRCKAVHIRQKLQIFSTRTKHITVYHLKLPFFHITSTQPSSEKNHQNITIYTRQRSQLSSNMIRNFRIQRNFVLQTQIPASIDVNSWFICFFMRQNVTQLSMHLSQNA
ncbi:hypothetical protein PanWU01x14_101080 [Parasponia andersonii]|uniref:Uncharacterized protein n=1 Tax=Parasponia andersonii TaxID=3476 RepID=A0A2P5D328_PARAD|nr:hypothetical protein PanWU01x14_101080 [Parasponia andersonii]